MPNFEQIESISKDSSEFLTQGLQKEFKSSRVDIHGSSSWKNSEIGKICRMDANDYFMIKLFEILTHCAWYYL